MHPPTPHRRQTRTWGKLCTLVVLLALALRVVYVPYHLAQEGHVWASGDPTVEHGFAEADAEHGHGHGHEHDGGHVPHSALDHETELIAQRGPSPVVRVEPAVLPLEFGALPTLGLRWAPAAPDPRPPDSRQRLAARPRGPPAAV